MKINDYINTPNYLNHENIITLRKYDHFIHYVTTTNGGDPDVVHINITQELLEHGDINEIFRSYHNKVVLLSNADIDFPPPKYPYKYDMFFDKNILPINDTTSYYDKLNTEIIDTISQNNLHVFVHANGIHHNRITTVPIGIYHKFNHFGLKTNPKTVLCYANFGLPVDRWFGNPRKTVLDLVKGKSFMFIENITYHQNSLDCNPFYQTISRSKFALCPRGCGIDTYRLWDCIVLGCIPIVERYDGHQSFNELPILFIDSVAEYGKLTAEFLNAKYAEFMERDDFNYDLLRFSTTVNNVVSAYKKLHITKRFGVYFQCYKNPCATYHCLLKLRASYPDCNVVLLSDNGYDYTNMAEHFHCKYIHENENISLVWKEFESGNHITNALKLMKRVRDAVELCDEEYIMWLEDDVLINGEITDVFKYNLNGFCPNRIEEPSIILLHDKYPFIDKGGVYRHSGHGGSVFHKETLLNSFNNTSVVLDVLNNWEYYGFATFWNQDLFFSILILLNRGTVGPYNGHNDMFDNNIDANISVQHQFKLWYDKPLPDDLKHLCTGMEPIATSVTGGV